MAYKAYFQATKIILVGDVHGKIRELNAKASENPEITHVQIGDVGFGFTKDITLAPNIAFFCGNHDCREIARKDINYLGDYGLIHGPNAECYFISGAESIDRHLRLPGVSWWEDEEMSSSELQKVIDDVLSVKPFLIASHECPASIIKHVGLQSAHYVFPASRTAHALETIFQHHKPHLWVFGHHHVKFDRVIDGTRFICLPELETLEVALG